MEQNSVMVENMGGKSTYGNNEQPAKTSLSTINGQRILTPEFSSLIASFNEIATKNFETGIKLGRETGNDFGMDNSISMVKVDGLLRK